MTSPRLRKKRARAALLAANSSSDVVTTDTAVEQPVVVAPQPDPVVQSETPEVREPKAKKTKNGLVELKQKEVGSQATVVEPLAQEVKTETAE